MGGRQFCSGEHGADLRAVPVRQHHTVTAFDQPDDRLGGFDGILELLLCGPLLSRPDKGVSAHRDEDEFGHISPAATRT